MRDIKFRGWAAIENKWVYGSLLQSEIDVNELNVKCQIHERFANDFSIAKYDVIPESVWQFTGLTDKNGCDIYEGHVVKCYLDHTAIGNVDKVEFKHGGFILRHRDCFIQEFMSHSGAFDCEVEVIGNIFENPELTNPK